MKRAELLRRLRRPWKLLGKPCCEIRGDDSFRIGAERWYNRSVRRLATRPATGRRTPRLAAGKRASRPREILTEDEALARMALKRLHEKEYSLQEVIRRAG